MTGRSHIVRLVSYHDGTTRPCAVDRLREHRRLPRLGSVGAHHEVEVPSEPEFGEETFGQLLSLERDDDKAGSLGELRQCLWYPVVHGRVLGHSLFITSEVCPREGFCLLPRTAGALHELDGEDLERRADEREDDADGDGRKTDIYERGVHGVGDRRGRIDQASIEVDEYNGVSLGSHAEHASSLFVPRLAALSLRSTRTRALRRGTPSMNVARTVLGDVDSSTLGRVDAHEHLMIMGGPLVDRDQDILLDDVDEAIAEAGAFRDAGGGTIVDALPTGCGRDAKALATISRETGIHIVATAGFHRSSSYPERHWARRYPVDLLTSVLLGEVIHGIDRWDLAGPVISSTGVRPGVLKVATGHNVIDPIEHRMLRAVAAVHRESGLPVLTHTEQGTFGSRQLDLLEEEGVDAARVMVGHLDRLPDLQSHRELAVRGAFLGYDGLGREKKRPFAAVAEVILQLIAEGFGGQLLLGGDVGRRSMRIAAGGLGVVGVLTTMVRDLVSSGIAEEAVQDMLVTNAGQFLRVTDHVE